MNVSRCPRCGAPVRREKVVTRIGEVTVEPDKNVLVIEDRNARDVYLVKYLGKFREIKGRIANPDADRNADLKIGYVRHDDVCEKKGGHI
jgi:hypothetical protein